MIPETVYKTSESVSRRMRTVRRRGTKCELALEVALRSRRLRFSTHYPVLGCTPDLVFRVDRLAVFVDGDFWHGRKVVELGAKALENSLRGKSRKFWIDKIKRNVTRDARQTRILRRHGWSVLRVWEREVLKDVSGIADVVCRRLDQRRRVALKHRQDVS
jgi:DNA mismatch endonuclease (patch repair protein)